jgi:hypothetical protein
MQYMPIGMLTLTGLTLYTVIRNVWLNDLLEKELPKRSKT